MTKKLVRILQLYPSEMNIYGDYGNVLVLQKRLEWRGYAVEILEHHPGQKFPKDVDIIVGGGGQDSGQNKIASDLLLIGDELKRLAEEDVPMLMICGMYQLFGRFFKTSEGEVIKGIGLFDTETIAGDTRLIGNIVTESELFGQIFGYENHSGLTHLGEAAQPLASVLRGAGNNKDAKYEGVIYRHVIGTYMHGSLLPKNPKIADFLIGKAVEKRYGDKILNTKINDDITEKAREVALKLDR